MPSLAGTVLVVGASRGLGASIAKCYASQNYLVLATARTSNPPPNTKNILYIPSFDVAETSSHSYLLSFLVTRRILTINIVILTSGSFFPETLSKPSYDNQLTMYKTCAIGPTLLITALATSPPTETPLADSSPSPLLGKGSKVILVSSEAGSITLRSETKDASGGGNYGHCASKAALNMCGRLLSFDLKKRGIAVACVHPGAMKTETGRRMSVAKNAMGHDPVYSDVAAQSLVDWIDTFDLRKTGQFWAPRGASDISTASYILGPIDRLPVPLQLPW